MKRVPVRIAGVALALAVTAGIGWLSQYPWESDPVSHAVIRLSWRTRSARVRECRAPTAEELAGVPAHMRPREVCEGRVLPYHLSVNLDGAAMVDQTIRGAGARGDRPLFIFMEFPVAAGSHDLSVRFEREDGGREESGNLAITPPILALDRELFLDQREIALVTYDAEARSRVVRGYGAQ